jgi:hypothetical protein
VGVGVGVGVGAGVGLGDVADVGVDDLLSVHANVGSRNAAAKSASVTRFTLKNAGPGPRVPGPDDSTSCISILFTFRSYRYNPLSFRLTFFGLLNTLSSSRSLSTMLR